MRVTAYNSSPTEPSCAGLTRAFKSEAALLDSRVKPGYDAGGSASPFLRFITLVMKPVARNASGWRALN